MNTAAAAAVSTSTLPTFADGEIYLGAIVSACGTYAHHTILLPGDHDDANWQDAMDWATALGGDLPNRIEQALLFATLKDQFKPDWYWSNTQPASDASYAWCQLFNDGSQDYSHVDGQCRARAVRRLPIQPFSNLA